jgi:hypothetical protein
MTRKPKLFAALWKMLAPKALIAPGKCEMWWVGLRDAEKETYQAHGHNFDEDERYFRCGFEAAQHSANRGKSYEECRARLGDRYPGAHEREPFRRGYQRGRAYFEALRKRANPSQR